MAVKDDLVEECLPPRGNVQQDAGFLSGRIAGDFALNLCRVKSVVSKDPLDVFLRGCKVVLVQRAPQRQPGGRNKSAGIQWLGCSGDLHGPDKVAGLARKGEDNALGFRLGVSLQIDKAAGRVKPLQALVHFAGIQRLAHLLDNLLFELVQMEFSVGFQIDANDRVPPLRGPGKSKSGASQPRKGQQYRELADVFERRTSTWKDPSALAGCGSARCCVRVLAAKPYPRDWSSLPSGFCCHTRPSLYRPLRKASKEAEAPMNKSTRRQVNFPSGHDPDLFRSSFNKDCVS